jgi:hypothetical protein
MDAESLRQVSRGRKSGWNRVGAHHVEPFACLQAKRVKPRSVDLHA